MQSSNRILLVLTGVATMLMLVGCGGPNLFDRVGGFWAYGICSAIVVVLDIIAIIEVMGSPRSSGDKALWILLIIFFPVGGLILFYIFGK